MKHPRLMHLLDYREPIMSGGEGAILFDDAGRRYIDFFADTGTSSLGYGSEEHRNVLNRLKEMPIHAPNMYRHTERDRAADRLCRATGMDKVFFCNSGVESVEAAIKIARLCWWQRETGDEWDHPGLRYGVPKRHVILTARGGFHGRTFGGMMAGDGPEYHTRGFGPHLEGFSHFGDPDEIDTDWARQNVAAIMMAPIMGNNDTATYSDSWWTDLIDKVQKTGALLIFDEVQTGSGRTGSFLYSQQLLHLGVRPDIVCLAKGLGMGAPVGATLARGEAAEVLRPRTHWSTFGGNPMSCAFINGFLTYLDNYGYGHIKYKGDFIRQSLEEAKWAVRKPDGTSTARGAGMMQSVEVAFDAPKMALEAEKQGLILGVFRPNIVKITPPLNIRMEELKEGLDILNRVAQRYV